MVRKTLNKMGKGKEPKSTRGIPPRAMINEMNKIFSPENGEPLNNERKNNNGNNSTVSERPT